MIRPLPVVGLVASTFAAATAYLIALDEAQHLFTSGSARRREALHTATATAVFFMAISAAPAVAVSTMH